MGFLSGKNQQELLQLHHSCKLVGPCIRTTRRRISWYFLEQIIDQTGTRREKFEDIAGSAFSKAEIDVLLNRDHFITTSAIWHQSEDTIKRKWSRIDELREMIVELCKAEEGEGIRTPLLGVIRRIEENLASIEEQRHNGK